MVVYMFTACASIHCDKFYTMYFSMNCHHTSTRKVVSTSMVGEEHQEGVESKQCIDRRKGLLNAIVACMKIVGNIELDRDNWTIRHTLYSASIEEDPMWIKLTITRNSSNSSWPSAFRNLLQIFLPTATWRNTVKPVYNDHLMGYFSAFWSSSR